MGSSNRKARAALGHKGALLSQRTFDGKTVYRTRPEAMRCVRLADDGSSPLWNTCLASPQSRAQSPLLAGPRPLRRGA